MSAGTLVFCFYSVSILFGIPIGVLFGVLLHGVLRLVFCSVFCSVFSRCSAWCSLGVLFGVGASRRFSGSGFSLVVPVRGVDGRWRKRFSGTSLVFPERVVPRPTSVVRSILSLRPLYFRVSFDCRWVRSVRVFRCCSFGG